MNESFQRMLSAARKIKPRKRVEHGVVRRGPHHPPGPEQRLPKLVWDRLASGTERHGRFIYHFHHFWTCPSDIVLSMTGLAERFLKLCMIAENNPYTPSNFSVVSE